FGLLFQSSLHNQDLLTQTTHTTSYHYSAGPTTQHDNSLRKAMARNDMNLKEYTHIVIGTTKERLVRVGFCPRSSEHRAAATSTQSGTLIALLRFGVLVVDLNELPDA
ncbi:hypothetical protein PIB30_072069, partial [Stylosanthes scabra]|nr:hypothetical protein [Stylosanthes scabra]